MTEEKQKIRLEMELHLCAAAKCRLHLSVLFTNANLRLNAAD